MKTKKFLMLLAAVLLSCASAMAQNSPLKGDVNGDGKVDVADIVAILDIMKNGTKEIQSIKWTSTTAVNGTTGTTPALGDITLTYNDGTTGTVAYNASGVTLYADAAGNTPFSNANAGTFNVWAKYCGMMTTNSKQVTLSAPVVGTYYWYAGTTEPTASNIASIKTGSVNSKPTTWTASNPQSISATNNTGSSSYIYYCFPTNWNVIVLDQDKVSEVSLADVSTFNLDGVEYTVKRTGRLIGNGTTKTYYASIAVKYYWYVGILQPTDPSDPTQNSGLNKWTSLGTTLPTSSIQVVKEDTTYADHTWYIAAPTAANFVIYNILNTSPELGVTKLNSINIGNVSYDVWKTNSEVDICQVYLHK